MEQDLTGTDYSTDKLLGQRVTPRSLWSYGGGGPPRSTEPSKDRQGVEGEETPSEGLTKQSLSTLA